MERRKDSNSFTSTEVGTLIESFRSDISVIAEDLSTVKKDVSELKTDMIQVKADLITIKDVIRVAIPSLNARVTALETKAGL